jgi:hypothetical protein
MMVIGKVVGMIPSIQISLDIMIIIIDISNRYCIFCLSIDDQIFVVIVVVVIIKG